MDSEIPHIGIWKPTDTITANKVQNEILKKLGGVISFPGKISEFKVFVGKLMGIEMTHPEIVPVYELIVGKTVNYFPSNNQKQTKKRRPKQKLTKIERNLKSMLEGMGISLKIPLSMTVPEPCFEGNSEKISLDKDWCNRERQRILELVKKQVGLAMQSDSKKRKRKKKKKPPLYEILDSEIEVIDIEELDEPSLIAEVVDITEQDETPSQVSSATYVEVLLEVNS